MAATVTAFWSALATALVFLTGASCSVFVTDQINPTFGVLEPRGCLPDDFDDSTTLPMAQDCAILVTGSNVPNHCKSVPLLALFYNCYATSRGLLNPSSGPGSADADDISALVATMKVQKGQMSEDEVWVNKSCGLLDRCMENAASGMSLRQLAIYNFLCLKWSWYVDCDCEQEEDGSLDAAGTLRRANFYCGECPLSPKSLQSVIESVAERTFADCVPLGQSPVDPFLKYEHSVNIMLCLLDRFEKGQNLDYSDLKDAISDELSGANAQDALVLQSIVEQCEDNRKTKDFIDCWAKIGVFSCVYQEANQVAGEYPDQCKLALTGST